MQKKIIIIIFFIGITMLSLFYKKRIKIKRQDRVEREKQIEDGRAFLKNMEKKDMEEIEKIISDNIEEKNKDEKFSWSLFNNTVFLGDSRTVGFKEYEYLDEGRVLAEVGDGFSKIPDLIDSLEVKNPRNIVFCYGINDLGYDAWSSPEKFSLKYYSYLKEVIKKMPNSKIYVCQIIPVTKSAEEKDEKYKDIYLINKALEKMCKEKNIGFINCDLLVSENIYVVDEGIHFKPEFYPVLGEHIYKNIK